MATNLPNVAGVLWVTTHHWTRQHWCQTLLQPSAQSKPARLKWLAAWAHRRQRERLCHVIWGSTNGIDQVEHRHRAWAMHVWPNVLPSDSAGTIQSFSHLLSKPLLTCMYPQSASAVPSPVSSHSCQPVIVNSYQSLRTSSASSQWHGYTLGLLAVNIRHSALLRLLRPLAPPGSDIALPSPWTCRSALWLHGGLHLQCCHCLQLSPWCHLFIFLYGSSLQLRPLDTLFKAIHWIYPPPAPPLLVLHLPVPIPLRLDLVSVWTFPLLNLMSWLLIWFCHSVQLCVNNPCLHV